MLGTASSGQERPLRSWLPSCCDFLCKISPSLSPSASTRQLVVDGGRGDIFFTGVTTAKVFRVNKFSP